MMSEDCVLSGISSNYHIFHYAAEDNAAIASSLNWFIDRSRENRRVLSVPSDFYNVVSSSEALKLHDSGYLTSYGIHLASPITGILTWIAGGAVAVFLLGLLLYRMAPGNWKVIFFALSGIGLCAGMIFTIRKIGTNPLRNIEPPDETTEAPLIELEHLAQRIISRLRIVYRIQFCLCALGVSILLFVILSFISMLVRNHLLFTVAFGIGVLGLIFLFEGKWRSFEGMVKIRKLAVDGVTLLEELRQRIKSISSIADPNERLEAQWIAVADYLD